MEENEEEAEEDAGAVSMVAAAAARHVRKVASIFILRTFLTSL